MVDRLADIAVGTHAVVARIVGTERVGGQRDHRNVAESRFMRTDMGERFLAVHHRHVHVEQHQIERPCLQIADRIGAVLGLDDLDAERFEEEPRDLAVERMIVDQQDRKPLGPAHAAGAVDLGLGRRLGFTAAGHGAEGQREGRALALLACRHQIALHQMRQLAADRQAEPGAAETACGGGVGLGEGCEQLVERFGAHADAGVGHRDTHLDGAVIGRHGACRNIDAALVGELDRIGNDIGDALPHADRVEAQEGRHRTVDRKRQRKPLFLCARRPELFEAAQQMAEIVVDRRYVETPGLDLGEIEHVVEDRHQRLAAVENRLDLVALLGREIARGHDLRHAENAVERRADLVADIGEKGRLGLVGGFGLLACLLQFAFAFPEHRDVGADRDPAAEGQRNLDDLHHRAEMGLQFDRLAAHQRLVDVPGHGKRFIVRQSGDHFLDRDIRRFEISLAFPERLVGEGEVALVLRVGEKDFVIGTENDKAARQAVHRLPHDLGHLPVADLLSAHDRAFRHARRRTARGSRLTPDFTG